MNLSRLAIRDVFENVFRSWIIVSCAFLVAGLSLATILITQGAGDSVRLTEERLGADIVLVPEGNAQEIESALFMGLAAQVRMPAENLEKARAVPGVEVASPQLYLMSMRDSDCCSMSDMFMIAYDPATDFTVEPWLEEELGRELGLGEVVGGTTVFVPPGDERIKLYGYEVDLIGNLEPTGSNLDASVFFTFETAAEMSEVSRSKAQQWLYYSPEHISSVMIKVAPGYEAEDVAAALRESVPGASPILTPNLFSSFRGQIEGQQTAMVVILGVVLALSLVVVVLVFSMMVDERRREIGVLRALGATRGAVLRSLLTSAAVLAVIGGASGIILAGLILYFFQHALTGAFGFPFLFPSVLSLVLLVVIGLVIALGTVLLAAFVPAYRISRQEPSISMRE
jgi:putative ABC transport system permease protein